MIFLALRFLFLGERHTEPIPPFLYKKLLLPLWLTSFHAPIYCLYYRYHYRSSVENLEDFSVALEPTGVSTNTVTQAIFNKSLVHEVAVAFDLNATSNLDVFVVTLDKNIFAYALVGTEGSTQAIESRADQPTSQSNGDNSPLLLRSDITMVEVSREASIEPLAEDVNGAVTELLEVKLLATVITNQK